MINAGREMNSNSGNARDIPLHGEIFQPQRYFLTETRYGRFIIPLEMHRAAGDFPCRNRQES